MYDYFTGFDKKADNAFNSVMMTSTMFVEAGACAGVTAGGLTGVEVGNTCGGAETV